MTRNGIKQRTEINKILEARIGALKKYRNLKGKTKQKARGTPQRTGWLSDTLQAYREFQRADRKRDLTMAYRADSVKRLVRNPKATIRVIRRKIRHF